MFRTPTITPTELSTPLSQTPSPISSVLSIRDLSPTPNRLSVPAISSTPDPSSIYFSIPTPPPKRGRVAASESGKKRTCPQCPLVLSSEKSLVVHLLTHNGNFDHFTLSIYILLITELEILKLISLIRALLAGAGSVANFT